MSISIDDLTSSLSSSHIGQEARDLAALQAQLAQTLFGQSIARSSNPRQVSRRTSFTQPCNTPTFSSNFSQFDDQRGQTATSKPGGFSFDTCHDMEEDERMVEDLLITCSPMSANHSAFQFSLPLSPGSKSHLTSNNQTSETSSSSFTSTDPFYMAQSQAQYHNPSPQSTFTQLGQLPQQSPFTFQQRRDHPGTSHSAPALSLDTHSFLVATSAH